MLVLGKTVVSQLSKPAQIITKLKLKLLQIIYFAVVDTLTLYFTLAPNWVTLLTGTNGIRLTHDVMCKLTSFLTYWLSDSASWLVVAITWERVLAVNFPHKIQVWTSKRKTYIYVATVLFLLAAINIHWIFAVKLHFYEPAGRVVCVAYTESYFNYAYRIFPYIDLFKYAILPFVLIILGNILIIGRMLHARRMVKRQLNVSQQNQEQISQMTLMLLGISTAFILFNGPIAFLIILDESASIQWDDYQQARLDFAHDVANMLMYTNNAANFYVYFLSGSRFRNEVKAMFSKKHGEN